MKQHKRAVAQTAYDSVADILSSPEITSDMVGQRLYTKDGAAFDVVASGGDFAAVSGSPLILKYANKDIPVPARVFNVSQDATDNAQNLNKAVSSLYENGGGTLLLEPGTYNAKPYETVGTSGRKGIINIKSGVKLVGNNTTLRKIGTGINLCGIVGVGADNWSVEGIRLIGNKITEAPIVENNAGCGFYINGCYDFVVRNCQANDWAIDGMYLGARTSGRTANRRGLIENFTADQNGRQGISLISGESLYFKNILLSNTIGDDGTGYGVAPGDGLDIEPNQDYEELANIIFDNLVVEGNKGSGIKFFMAAFTTSSKPIGVSFNNTIARNNGYAGIRFRRNRAPGRIDFNGLTYCHDNKATDFSYETMENVRTRVSDLLIHGAKSPLSTAVEAPLNIGVGANSTSGSNDTAYGVEGLTIDNLNISIKEGLYTRGVSMFPRYQPFARDISLKVGGVSGQSIQDSEVSISYLPDVSRNISVTGNVSAVVDSTSSSFRTYSGFRHRDLVKVTVVAADPLNVAGLGRGTSTEYINDRSSGVVVIGAGGETILPLTSGQTISLPSRGCSVRVARSDTGELRIVGGVGWTPAT